MAHALGHLIFDWLSGVVRCFSPHLSRFQCGLKHRTTLNFLFATIGAVLVVLPSTAFAQPAPQPIRFTVFAAKQISGLTYVPRVDVAASTPKKTIAPATPIEIRFNPTARSKRLEYRGPMPLRFVDSESGAVVAEATIPPTIRDALLLFSPMADATANGLR